VKLTIFVGSPRGKKSNTNFLLQHFLNGFEATSGNSYELFYLNHLKDTDRFVRDFAGAEIVLLTHPLYTDAMPGMVKGFIEALEPLCGREDNPELGFIVQSGFGEAEHRDSSPDTTQNWQRAWAAPTWERSSRRTVNRYKFTQRCSKTSSRNSIN
jgi:multimeric flavodoxin WrbA